MEVFPEIARTGVSYYKSNGKTFEGLWNGAKRSVDRTRTGERSLYERHEKLHGSGQHF